MLTRTRQNDPTNAASPIDNTATKSAGEIQAAATTCDMSMLHFLPRLPNASFAILFPHSPFSSCRLFQTFLAICNASKLGQIIKSKSYTHVPKYTLKIFFPFCFQTKKLNNVIQNEFIGATIKINKYENKLISIKKKEQILFLVKA